MAKVMIAAALVMLTAMGCGGGADYSALSDEDVYEQAGIESDRYDTGEGTYFEDYHVEGCLTDQVLRGKAEVDMFTSAGDQVVTTEDGQLGLVVQVIDPSYSEDQCDELVGEALDQVEP